MRQRRLTLNQAATLTLDPGEPTIAAGQLVSIAQYVDGGWYEPANANVQLRSGGLVSATISLLAPVAIVVTEPPQTTVGAITGSVFHIYLEEPLANIGFELQSGSDILDTASSDSTGSFGFDAVPIGIYTVHSTIAPENNCYSDPVDKEVIVTEDQVTETTFGFVPGPC